MKFSSLSTKHQDFLVYASRRDINDDEEISLIGDDLAISGDAVPYKALPEFSGSHPDNTNRKVTYDEISLIVKSPR